MLWFHVPRTKLVNILSLAISTAILVFQRVLWICLIYYRNRSFHPVNKASVQTYNNRIFELKIDLSRPWTPLPGQYFYITAPTLSYAFTSFQEHPYSIAWFENDENGEEGEKNESNKSSGKATSIVVFIEARTGFSKYIENVTSFLIRLNGPHGRLNKLTSYDKVQFYSDGIGIAPQLSAIKFLLEAHDEKTARVRRVDLVWFSKCQGKHHWVNPQRVNWLLQLDQNALLQKYFKKLLKADKRIILNIGIFDPMRANEEEFMKFWRTNALDRIWQVKENYTQTSIVNRIDGNHMMEAGSSAVISQYHTVTRVCICSWYIIGCGCSEFDQMLRGCVRRSRSNASFISTDFEPDKAWTSSESNYS